MRRNAVRSLAAGLSGRLLVSIFALLILAAPVLAYTPDSPEVADMVERGITFLELNHGKATEGVGMDPNEEGARMLCAYAHYKVRRDPEHPVVQSGLQTALELARIAAQGGLPTKAEITYETSVAILLLIDLDPARYATQIQGLGSALMAVQKPHGGFGYLNEELGDTSQTQYCVLALWTMDQADFDVPTVVMDRALRYLLRTQDPTGQWGYKGRDSHRIGLLVPQDDRKGHSLTVAGAGSVLIAGDFFGLWRSSKQKSNEVEGLPPALKEVIDQTEIEAKREAFDIPPDQLMNFVQRSENWLDNNPYKRPSGKTWYYYYMYTLERFESFLEVARGEQVKEPDWYNQGVEELRAYQGPEGDWGSGPDDLSHSRPDISTSFAILFLIRSTKKAIGDSSAGVLAGGYDLPKDTTNIRVEGTQIKAKPVATAVSDLLGLLEDEDASSLDTGSIPEDLKLADDPEDRRKQLSRLERLARGSQSWQARRVAVRLLGQSDSLTVVPTLIYALSDPDPKVRTFARDGLRFISRKFDGFGMPNNPTPQEVRQAMADWRTWYKRLDPGYVFVD